jgi:hypothetical protein
MCAGQFGSLYSTKALAYAAHGWARKIRFGVDLRGAYSIRLGSRFKGNWFNFDQFFCRQQGESVNASMLLRGRSMVKLKLVGCAG